MNIYEKLLHVQTELKAPKSQFNNFGGYSYRNCEDILEAVKPICKKYNALVFLSDQITVQGERYYVMATATFVDVESCDRLETYAFAREEESKKGMDGSQVTGASSSYARKYALNGLFDIDDTKDSDTTNTHGKEEPKAAGKDANVPPKTENKAPEGKKAAKQLTPREQLIEELHRRNISVGEYAKEKGLGPNTTPERFAELLKELG